MTYLTLMLIFIVVVLDSLASKLSLLFANVDEYMKVKSRGNNKRVHGKNHFNINHRTDQGVLY